MSESTNNVLGWKLDRSERETLLSRFPPRYANIVADHVTLMSPVPETWPLPPPVSAAIIGLSDDGTGVEAMVVAIDGSTARPDGSVYHITWSLGPNRKAVESNEIIAKHHWRAFGEAIPISLTPTRWPSSR